MTITKYAAKFDALGNYFAATIKDPVTRTKGLFRDYKQGLEGDSQLFYLLLIRRLIKGVWTLKLNL